MPEVTPPFAPPRAGFGFVGLAGAAARAPLGGPREALLGLLMSARLASGLLPPHPLTLETRRARGTGARSWLTAVAVPTKLRTALQRAIAASGEDDARALADAIEAVTDITAPHLDRAARSEVARLLSALRETAVTLAAPAHRAVE